MGTLRMLLSKAVLSIAILIFAVGFFPYKPFISGRNEFTAVELARMPKAPFDKVIFMVIDALRSDFVYSNNSAFEYVQSLIRDGYALPFTAHASSPTITMPKVKAITTGSVPSFLDVILNFAESDTTSTLAQVDTWLDQLRHQPGGKLVMYGDDTWLKLFPSFFERADGTTSFFVSDFTEVDNNVTRHLNVELDMTDWNGWIMHYLGLDHIGHKSGPQSPHMLPKQAEMDKVIQQLFSAMQIKEHLSSTLLVLCGDHGMNDAGNHGGAAPGETSPALIFISPKMRLVSVGEEAPQRAIKDFEYYRVVEQSDIAPTISALMGLPLPLNNLGVMIPRILDFWQDESDRIWLLEQNVRQMHEILEQTIGHSPFDETSLRSVNCSSASNDLEHLQCGWSAQRTEMSDIELKYTLLYKYLRTSQLILSSTASNYDISKLATGLTLSACLLAFHLKEITRRLSSLRDWAGFTLGCFVLSLYCAMTFASSFVEEEHQFWYWTANLLGIYLFTLRPTSFPRSTQGIGMLIVYSLLLRILRRWNQTGQKYAGSPDIGRSYLNANALILWSLIFATHLHIGRKLTSCRVSRLPAWLMTVFTYITVLLALIFKASFTSADAPELMGGLDSYFKSLASSSMLVTQARLLFTLVWVPVGGLCFVLALDESAAGSKRAIGYLFTLFLMVQTRATNIPLVLLFDLMALCLEYSVSTHSILSPVEIGVCSMVLQYTAFFSFGGTNTISSIDLSSAYNGVSDYNILAVGVLTFVGNWTGPIWWSLRFGSSLSQRATLGDLSKYIHTTDLFVSGSLLATMLACTLLRTHLFIWTVFSPKYLYTIAWFLVQHLVINVGLTSCIYRITVSSDRS